VFIICRSSIHSKSLCSYTCIRSARSYRGVPRAL